MKRLYFLLILSFFLFGTSAHASRDDVLVLVNDNSIDSPQIAEYYVQQRNINPANIVHLRVRDGYFITWTEFRRMRDQVIRFMQQNTLDDPSLVPATCPDGDPPYYCQASMDQMRAHTKIRYVVTTRGIPTRTTVDGSNLSTPTGPTSVDNYLRFWLINFYDQDTAFSAQARASAFKDGRGMRTVIPAQDGELIVGRIDGVALDAAKALVDRAIEAERNGLFGKLYGSKYMDGAKWYDFSTGSYVYGDSSTSWRYQLGLVNETRPECIEYLDYPHYQAAGKAPQYCFARLTTGGVPVGGPNDPQQGVPSSRAPLADDALAYLGSLDGQSTGAGNFNNLLNWRRDDSCTVTLCENASDPAACRAASTDYYRDINTQCVGVSEGFIGYNFQSYPVSFLTVWPTSWRSTEANGEFNNLAFPEVRGDLGYDDNYSLWFRTADQVATPLCYSASDYSGAPTQPCLDERRVFFYQTIPFAQANIVNTGSPQQYRIGLRYKANNLTKTGKLRVKLWVHEKDATTNLDYGYKDIVALPLGNTGWTYGEVVFTLDPARHTRADDIFDRIQVDIDTSAVLAGELGLDTVTIQEVGTGTELAQNGSFNQGHKSVSGGDFAANYLSRLNGTAFWGSVSHHESSGFSFSSHPMETLLYFMRGLPLGDAVWFNESRNSGILYGDPLYSPMAVKFDFIGDRMAGSALFSGSTVNGRDASLVSTSYQVDYCSGKDFYVCDQDQSWLPTGMYGSGGHENHALGSWDISNLPWGDYTLRLAVTSSNAVAGKAQTFNDFYPIKHRYADAEIPTYNISGYVKEPSGEPVVGVTFAINDNYGFASSATTDTNGYFKSAALKNGTYIVYPTKQGYSIAPDSGNVFQTISSGHVRRDFTATRSGYSITGRVNDSSGQPLAGVQVQSSGPNGYTASVNTNINGYFGFGSLANGSYIVSASLPGYAITPDGGNATAVVNGADIAKGFTATTQSYIVSGTILDNKGQPLAGAKVQVSDNNGYMATVTTNANGHYRQGGLANGLYLVYPYFPEFNIVANVGNGLTSISGANVSGKDFTATPMNHTYSISGFILQNGQPVPGVSVAINDNYGFTSSVTTDGGGFYSKDGLKNGLYLVYPTKSGYQFQVTSGTLFQNISGSNVIGKDFNALSN